MVGKSSDSKGNCYKDVFQSKVNRLLANRSGVDRVPKVNKCEQVLGGGRAEGGSASEQVQRTPQTDRHA